jgi:two-component system sensor histidine kinase BaeS
MFQQIRGILFVAIVGVNALLAPLTYLVISWSFDRGFIEFLDRADQERLQPLMAELTTEYGRHGSWDWIAGDRELWRELRRRYFWAGAPPPADGSTQLTSGNYVVAVLRATAGVAARGLQMAVVARADPNAVPCRRNGESTDACQRGAIPHRSSFGIQVTKRLRRATA